MAAVAAAPPVRSKVKKAGQRARRNSSSSDTESANSIGPDSDEGESGPPIILEDVAPSEKIRSKKAKKASERPTEAADESSEVKKKEKKHKKHKTADGDEKSETKHKKKHKERSESPGGTKEKKSSSRSKSSKKAKETSEAVVGGKAADDLYQNSKQGYTLCTSKIWTFGISIFLNFLVFSLIPRCCWLHKSSQ